MAEIAISMIFIPRVSSKTYAMHHILSPGQILIVFLKFLNVM